MATIDFVLTLVIGFALLVFFHELGHFLFAKFFKMRVEEFAIGMGNPKFRLFRDSETEYNLRAIPLGGFVRISGMEIEDEAEQRIANFGARKEKDEAGVATANDVVGSSPGGPLPPLSPDDPRAFNNKPIWQRFLVILAGPVFSVLLGWFVFSLIGATVGIPTRIITTTTIAEVVSGSVAERAGLRKGDTITAIDGVPTTTGEAMVKTIRASADKPLSLALRAADNKTRTVSVTPQQSVTPDGKKAGLIGIAPQSSVEDYKRVSLAESFSFGTAATVGYYDKLIGIFRQGKVRENIGGPIAIARVTGDAVKGGAFSKMELLGSLSLSLAFFNMLPIPVLDGGHLMLFTLEAIRGRKLSPTTQQRVLLAGFAVILLFVAFVFVNDISKLRLFGG